MTAHTEITAQKSAGIRARAHRTYQNHLPTPARWREANEGSPQEEK